MTVYNDPIVDQYLRKHTMREDEALRKARERAAMEDMPPIPQEVGAFLCLAVRWTRARNILEIGSGGGVSGIWIARGLPVDGHLTTIELDPEHRRLALESYQEAGVTERVSSLLGNALDVLPGLPDASYDMIFIDPAKAEYPQYLDHALRLVVQGGVIIADNVLWSGRIADPRATDPEDEGLRIYNQRIATDPRLHSVILPLGDGVAVSLVLS
jgi:predicted O-methyltransferase YrrM